MNIKTFMEGEYTATKHLKYIGALPAFFLVGDRVSLIFFLLFSGSAFLVKLVG